MSTITKLLNAHDGKRMNGADHFTLLTQGLMDRKGKLTEAGKAMIAPALEQRAASKAKAVEIMADTTKANKARKASK